jgi:hypothetical protein
MKQLIAAVIAALFAAVTLSAVAAEDVKQTDPTAKPAKAKKHHKKDEAKKTEPAAPAKQ